MMSKTGKTPRGFTLIEVLVATCLLALGTVLISEGFIQALNAHSISRTTLELSWWMDDLLWQAQDSLSRTAALNLAQTSGTIMSNNKKVRWELSYGAVNQIKDFGTLYSIGLTVSWTQGKRLISLSRTVYALYEKM